MNTFRCFPHSLDTLVFVKQCVQYEMQTFQNAIFKMLFRKRLLLVCFIVFSPGLNLYQNERVISNASGSWNECFSRKFHIVLPSLYSTYATHAMHSKSPQHCLL